MGKISTFRLIHVLYFIYSSIVILYLISIIIIWMHTLSVLKGNAPDKRTKYRTLCMSCDRKGLNIEHSVCHVTGNDMFPGSLQPTNAQDKIICKP